MKFTRIIVGLCFILVFWSCAQYTSKGQQSTQVGSNLALELLNAINIENGSNRGTFFANSQGIEYSHSHKTIRITNESKTPITLKIALPNEYVLPAPYDHEKFKIVLWPEKLTPEKDMFLDSISTELRAFFESDFDGPIRVNTVLQPSEVYELTTGTWHIPTDSYASVIGLFLEDDDTVTTCEPLTNSDTSEISSFPLKIYLNFSGVSCNYLPFGEVSFSKE